MKIDFVRSGGVGGLRLQIDLETDELERGLATELQGLIHDSGFFEIRQPRPRRRAGVDRFQYRLRISSPGLGDRRLEIEESGVPNGLLPLLMRLTDLALAGRKGSTGAGKAD